jgi:hypothetical protein
MNPLKIPVNPAEVLQYYQSMQKSLSDEVAGLQKRVSTVSWARLAGFLLVIILIYVFANTGNTWWLALSIILFSFFVFLVAHHQKLHRKLGFARARLALTENELEVLAWRPSVYDTGESFQRELPFADDLDLFGSNSMFHYLNRCATPYGRRQLANSLKPHLAEDAKILSLQEAVASLKNEPVFRLRVMALLFQAERGKGSSVMDTGKGQQFPCNLKRLKLLRLILPSVLAISALIYLFSGLYSWIIIAVIANLLVASSYARKAQWLQEQIGGKKDSFKTMHEVFHQFRSIGSNAQMIADMQQTSGNALKELHALGVLAEWFDRRANILLYFTGNALFLLDLNLIYRYGLWLSRNQDRMAVWFDTLGKLEMLMSYAVFAFNRPDYVFPKPWGSNALNADQLGHPLIPDPVRVNNDVRLSTEGGVQLVTGSNMAGKSTYLRTLGVNVILAQAGAPVCASAFGWKPCLVLSSLRQSDSLHENTSLFMNELKQLKFILEEATKVNFSLILLDEVLRGTNSDDKYAGTYELLKKVSKFSCLAVAATHDLRLSTLEEEFPGRFVNYSFESYLSEDQLLFDYIIKRGVAGSRNATWLMKNMGLIE